MPPRQSLSRATWRCSISSREIVSAGSQIIGCNLPPEAGTVIGEQEYIGGAWDGQLSASIVSAILGQLECARYQRIS